jgi:L-asparagine transporter-like permease
MRDIFQRLTSEERRAINQLRLRVILFYVLLIVALVAFTSIRAMWGGGSDVMEAQAKGTDMYAKAGRPSAR